MRKIKLALGTTSLLSPATGIASYTRHLAEALGRNEDVEVCHFYGRSWSRKLHTKPSVAVKLLKNQIKTFLPNPYALTRFVMQQVFSIGALRYRPDIYHEPNFLLYRFSGPTVVTVHDLSHIHYAHTHPADRVRIMNKLLPESVERATEILVDSHYVGRELVEQFGISPDKVHTIHLGVSKEYKPRPATELVQPLMRYGLAPQAYILAVGTLEPRKNLLRAIDAFAGLPNGTRKATPLVIAGMKGWLSDELEARIQKYESRGEVRWLGYVPAADLPLLYSGATMLVYPSLYEGFGLPVLEAMASGVPVVTSDRASLPEVAGDVGILVDPESVDALRESMRCLVEDRAQAARLGALGVERARQFSWQACAEKTLSVYRKAMAKTN